MEKLHNSYNKSSMDTNQANDAKHFHPNNVLIDEEQRRHAKQKQEELRQGHIFWELIHFLRHRHWKKKVLTVIILFTSSYVIYDLIFLGHVRNGIEYAVQWMTRNVACAVVSLIVLFIVGTLLFVPPALIMFGTGYAFAGICRGYTSNDTIKNNDDDDSHTTTSTAPLIVGIIAAIFISMVGCCIGAILAFVRARYMMRDLIELFARRYPIVQAMDRALSQNGFRVMLLLRLCPIIPFNGLNYIGGITAVSLEEYTWALIGIFPTVVFWVIVGASADQVWNHTADDTGEQVYQAAILAIGVVSCIIAIVLIWKYAGIELQHEMQLNNAESWRKYKSPSHSCHDIQLVSHPIFSPAFLAKQSGRTESTAATTGSNSDWAFSPDIIEHGIEVEAWKPPGPLDVLGIHHYEVPRQRPQPVLADAIITNDGVEVSGQYHLVTAQNRNDAPRFSDNDVDEEWFWIWT
jgi:uncharacterized membrane protein YdjX (TVP38/TMEM64 family)